MILMNSISRIDFGKGIFTYEIFSLLLILGCYGFIKDKLNIYIQIFLTYISNIFINKQTTIEFIGWEFLTDKLFTFEYPHNMKAINYYIYSKSKSKNFRYFNDKKNGIYYADEMKSTLNHDNTPNYILGEVENIHLEDDIYLSLNIEENNSSDKSSLSMSWKIVMKIKSYKLNPTELQKFIDKCIIEYDHYIINKNKNKTYHFIYEGKNSNKLMFSSKIISDFSNPELENYETFDNIFHSNKKLIINDINRLKDINYYKRTGLKRKKGYLFYGQPGTGKTATVMAISNYDKRHIIEIPLNRVKTNNELEQILTMSQINTVKFNPDNVIIFFDEIDIGTNLIRKKSLGSNCSNESDCSSIDNETKKIKKNSKTSIIDDDDTNIDKLNIGTLLSRLDGIGNYAGLIVIGATNDISNIDKALYRDGRLTLITFNNASSDDLKNIIEKYYMTKLNDIQLEIISKFNMKFSHAKIRLKLEHFENLNDFFEVLIKLESETKSDSDISDISESDLIFE